MAESHRPEYGLKRGKKKIRKLRWIYLVFMVLLAIFCMALATQRIAAFFNYHPALGQPLGEVFGRSIYAPWQFLRWQSELAQYDAYGLISEVITQSQLLFLAPQFLVIGIWMCFLKNLKADDALHGSATWANEEDIETMGLLRGQGVYVGGWVKPASGAAAIAPWHPKEKQIYLRHNGPEHILVFAPTRSGKGVGLIIPTLLAWPGSAIILDIKGENWSLSSGYRQSTGQKTIRFDPSDNSGASASFNPLEEIRLDSLLAISDVQNIAAMLVDPTGKGMDDHWSKTAWAMLGGALLHCCIMIRHGQKRTANLYDLSVMLADESRSIEELFKEMVDTDHKKLLAEIFPNNADQEYGEKSHVFIASSAREMLNKAPNESSGVVSTAISNLALYRDPIVAKNTSRCDFRIDNLMNHSCPVSLYLVLSPAEIDRMKPLIRLMLDLFVRRICAKMEFDGGQTKASYKHRLLLMLDEFSSLGKIAIIEKALAFMAGYGVKSYIIVQDITQLQSCYGKENSIMANCHVRVAYAPNTIETAKTLSAMSGQTTVIHEKVSLSGSRTGFLKNASVNMTETARPLLTPDETLRLPGPTKDAQGRIVAPGDMLIFTAGHNPIYGRQILFFIDPTFSARSKLPPPGCCAAYPAGVSDGLYGPILRDKPKLAIPNEKPALEGGDYAAYFK